ncbi:hypothetical protein EPJ69_00050 [Brachyspira aalborgi]|uniref:Uncharacterized protein n=1 Tax=Brachyspira aalborgi TaxID=29522 RepID=A0A5C8EFY8_9SPIR|nr:hypothetical protein [Brachyspira aalborgi]TXJ34970.1 hypothetical protein EPJ69_00050 [Brachyspira aalborgi]
MTQKNKIFSITLLLLILGSVACRKSGGGGDPTPQNPNMSIGNLLIISTNGKDTVQGISLRFDYADATVSDVVIDATNDMSGSITKDNFLIENNTLKLKDVDLTAKKAAVSNFATLTFSLTPNSSTPITKYTETADIYIGKYSNIYTNTFDAFTNIGGKTTGGILNADVVGDGKSGITFKFDDDTKTYFNTNTFYITNDNQNSDANVPVKGFAEALTKKLKENTIIKTYFNVDSIKVTAPTITDTAADKQAVFKVDLTPNSVLFETPYTSYDFIIDPKGKWLTDK